MALELYIGGVLKQIAKGRGLSVSWRHGGRGAMSFSVISADGSYQPQEGQSAALWLTGVKIWSGLIYRVSTTALYRASLTATPSLSTCQCVTHEFRLDKRIVPPCVYVNKTAKYIIEDILANKLPWDGNNDLVNAAPNIQAGATIPRYIIDHSRFSEVLDDLAAQSDYIWYVDVDENLIFIPRLSSPVIYAAPFDISDATPHCREITLERNLDGFRSRQYIRISYDAFAMEEQSFVGDGATRDWTLQDLDTSPVLESLVNYVERITVTEGSPITETEKSFGVYQIDTDKDFYYTPGDSALHQDTGGTTLTSAETLNVWWRQIGTDVMMVEDTVVSQARQVIEGGTGLHDHMIDNGDEVDATGHLAKAQAVLDAKKIIQQVISGVTDEDGLRPGQVMNVTLTVPNVTAMIMIDEVSASLRGETGASGLRYTFRGSVAAYADWVRSWDSILKAAARGVSRVRGLSTASGTWYGTIYYREFTLTVASTEITVSTTALEGAGLIVMVMQDATGGREITWNAAEFSGAPTVNIWGDASTYSMFQFVGRADGKWWFQSMSTTGQPL